MSITAAPPVLRMLAKPFDLHIDATSIVPAFETFLIKVCGFWRNDFCGHPEGVEGHEPDHHLTLQLETGKEFRDMFDKVVGYARERHPMTGYIEGEFIGLDIDLPELRFAGDLPIPFAIETGTIVPGTFRESEIHVTMSRDNSDHRLRANMLKMGFFSAYLPKKYGVAEVFTVQGTREQIDALIPAVRRYLESAGGSVKCSIKEERVADFWLSSPDVHCPPIVNRINWRPA
jgi:hypothetical protein